MNTKNITTTFIILAVVFTQATTLFAQNVGINEDGSEPDNRAILELKSNSKGVILPRLSDSERDALYQDVPEGMIIYNTTDQQLQIFMSNKWYPFSMGTPEDAPELTVTDEDGNVYSTVQIGDQVWMAENLKTTTYNDGTSIALVTNFTDWLNNTSGAYCWYQWDNTYADTYGALYNWYAVNTGNLCPDGWHVPTDEEWKTLEMHLGMSQAEADGTSFRGTNEGSKLAGNATLWNNGALENDSEFGSSGFFALPGGYLHGAISFGNESAGGYWWTSTEDGISDAWRRGLSFGNLKVNRSSRYKEDGFSIRCLKD